MSRLAKLGFINTQRTRGPVRNRIRSRGVPTALQNYEVLVSEDQDETMEMLGAFLGPTKLVVQGAPDEFVATFHALRLRDVTLAYLDFHTAVELNIEHTREIYTVHMPMNGMCATRFSDGREMVANTLSAAVVNPGDEVTMNWAFDSPQLIVRVEARAVQRQLARMLGHRGAGEVVFAPEFELAPDPAVRWHNAVNLLSTEAMTPLSLVQQGVGGGPVEELVITTLLWVQESNVHDQLFGSPRRQTRRFVREAMVFIAENLANPITLEDIAQAAHVSVRSMQQGFRSDLGTTPMAFLRDRRLDRARADLSDAVVTDDLTVTDVAERWGFGHLGNFALHYRKRFGESPSQTLRR